jgi:hypothetical protein
MIGIVLVIKFRRSFELQNFNFIIKYLVIAWVNLIVYIESKILDL